MQFIDLRSVIILHGCRELDAAQQTHKTI